MPTVLREGPYRAYFHSHDPIEPPRVHVDREDRSVKVLVESRIDGSEPGLQAE
jgi:hypothetical protein